jgi:hypothetical protein
MWNRGHAKDGSPSLTNELGENSESPPTYPCIAVNVLLPEGFVTVCAVLHIRCYLMRKKGCHDETDDQAVKN